NNTVELMADLGRRRGDLWVVGLWEDSLTVTGNEVFYTYQVYNQAIVVPESIDAIRALTGSERDSRASITRTDHALGITRDFLRWLPHAIPMVAVPAVGACSIRTQHNERR